MIKRLLQRIPWRIISVQRSRWFDEVFAHRRRLIETCNQLSENIATARLDAINFERELKRWTDAADTDRERPFKVGMKVNVQGQVWSVEKVKPHAGTLVLRRQAMTLPMDLLQRGSATTPA